MALARFAALAGSGALTQVSADAYAADARLVRRGWRGPGSVTWSRSRAVLAVRWETSGHGTAATPLGGFLDRIAETIIRAGAAAG